jgi:hypothetical protein
VRRLKVEVEEGKESFRSVLQLLPENLLLCAFARVHFLTTRNCSLDSNNSLFLVSSFILHCNLLRVRPLLFS